MIWVDYAILAIVGVSGVISLVRGFVREALSLAGWIAAFWIAIAYSGRVASWLEGYVTVPSVRVAVGFAVLFVLVLLACGIVLRMAGALVSKTGMSGTDRTLGIVFGVLRGVVIAGLLVLLAGLTPLPRDPWWSESSFLPHFVDFAHEVLAYLPAEFRQHFDLGSQPELDCDPEQRSDCDPERELDVEAQS